MPRSKIAFRVGHDYRRESAFLGGLTVFQALLKRLKQIAVIVRPDPRHGLPRPWRPGPRSPPSTKPLPLPLSPVETMALLFDKIGKTRGNGES